jgi:hypothetical protein
VIRARLLEPLVEDDPFRRASRLLTFDHDNEIIVDGLALVLSCLILLVVVLFGSYAGALIIIHWRLPLVALWPKNTPTASSLAT